MPQSSEEKLSEILDLAAARVTPSREERERVREVVSRAASKMREALSKLGVRAHVTLVGSIARDTWISGEADVDLFVLFNRDFPPERLGPTVLEAAGAAFGSYELRYSSHPYARVTLNGYHVDIVPAYEIRDASELVTAVDRSTLHNSYLIERMTEEHRKQARLLRAFMKAIGAYGAEVKVGGFSGYLCDLLILAYGSFLNLLRRSIEWREPQLVTVGGVLPTMDIDSYGRPPLLVPDPVDPRRNAAAAVSRTQFHRFRAAAKSFLRSPSVSFFSGWGGRPHVPTASEVVGRRLDHILLVKFRSPAPPDTVWTQVRAAERYLVSGLEREEFRVLGSDSWTDERGVAAVLVEPYSLNLPPVVRRVGPPVCTDWEEGFLARHLKSDRLIAGPTVEGDRWVVLLRRRWTAAADLLAHLCDSAGMPKLLRGGSPEVIPGREAISDRDVADFVESYLFAGEPFAAGLVDP